MKPGTMTLQRAALIFRRIANTGPMRFAGQPAGLLVAALLDEN